MKYSIISDVKLKIRMISALIPKNSRIIFFCTFFRQILLQFKQSSCIMKIEHMNQDWHDSYAGYHLIFGEAVNKFILQKTGGYCNGCIERPSTVRAIVFP